jgi:hypothetical protein
MIIRNSTESGDFTFGKGLSDYLTKQDAILHNVKTRLLQWKGDCFYAVAEGVDYNNLLDVGTKNLLDSDVKRVILQSEGVIKINNFESVLDNSERAYSSQATITTIFGTGKLLF